MEEHSSIGSVSDVYKILAENGVKNRKQRQTKMDGPGYCQYRNDIVWDLCRQLSISEDDLNSLNIIHVAGSKGKGSTCTLIESIMRESGIKTGLFTSPHIMKVTERICIDGKPIKDEKFIKIFQRLWSEESRRIFGRYNRPPYFFVFFCMALRAFIDEEVEVAIIEVGIGGEYDSTNIIPKPVACAIALLEIEHPSMLGNDLASIAWHKSGIFKPGANAFTIPQKDTAMVVLKERAEERKCDLKVARKLSYFIEEWNRKIEIGLKGKFQHVNASLAIEVCLTWMKKMGKIVSNNEELKTLPENVIDGIISGLKKAFILARFQTVERPGITFYIDIAHTEASMENAIEWFRECCDKKEKEIPGKLSKILVFGAGKHKNHKVMISVLQKLKYDKIVFPVCQMANAKDAITLRGTFSKTFLQASLEAVVENWKILDKSLDERSIKLFEGIDEAVAWLSAGRDENLYSKAAKSLGYMSTYQDKPAGEIDHLQVLVVGSPVLMQGVLQLLDN